MSDAELELVIKIPKEMYKWVNDENKFFDDYGVGDFVNLVRNGTLIPEGHGKIIDVNDLDVTTIVTDDGSGNEMLDVVLKEDIDDAHDLLSTMGKDKTKGLEEPEEDMER